MLRRIIGVVLTVICAGCAINTPPNEEQPPTPTLGSVGDLSTVDLKWLEYADPLADANLAIAKQNFNLFAFSRKQLTLPGINLQEYTFQWLQQHCGVKVVNESLGSQLSESNTLQGKKLETYVRVYNKHILAACLAPKES